MEPNDVHPVLGMPQMFTKCDVHGKILLIIAKIVNDFLIAGVPQHIHEFHADIAKLFKVGRFLCDTGLVFNRLQISQEEDGSINFSMQEYIDKIENILLDRLRRKQQEDACSIEELKMLQALAGRLNWLGNGVLQPATYLSSFFPAMDWRSSSRTLMKANWALHEIRKLQAIMRYKAPTHFISDGEQAAYLAFSDASSGKTSYGQTGYVSGIFFPSSAVYHLIDCHSSKQSHVSFSSMAAEILAAAESADQASLLAYCLNELSRSKLQLPLVLTVDSHGLYSTISTLHEGRDYRLRSTVARSRYSFERGEISVIQWIEGLNNIADALTKRKFETFRLLNKTCVNGTIPINLLDGTERVTSQ